MNLTMNASYDTRLAAVNEIVKNMKPNERALVAYTILADMMYGAEGNEAKENAFTHACTVANNVRALASYLRAEIRKSS